MSDLPDCPCPPLPCDHTAFLRAIIAEPDDDLPRLVFADWLDERGEPARAEFIRVQCELAKLTWDDCRLPTCPDCVTGQNVPQGPLCRWHALRRRERQLIMFMGKEAVPMIGGAGVWGYDAEAREWSMGGTINGVLTRGFISAITCTWADWYSHSAALLTACPLRGKDGLIRLTTPPVESQVRDEYAKMDWSYSSGRAIDRGDMVGALREVYGCRFELPTERPVDLRRWPGVTVEDAMRLALAQQRASR